MPAYEAGEGSYPVIAVRFAIGEATVKRAKELVLPVSRLPSQPRNVRSNTPIRHPVTVTVTVAVTAHGPRPTADECERRQPDALATKTPK